MSISTLKPTLAPTLEQLKNQISNLAGAIDHTLLKADYRQSEITQLCQEALQYQFKGVCIPSAAIPNAVLQLQNLSLQNLSLQNLPNSLPNPAYRPLIVTVVGFPLGHSLTEAKVAEATAAIKFGANEIDMVIHVAALLDGQWQQVENDIRAVIHACHPLPVKVIIETAYLNQEQKTKAALIAEQSGATFVKTSTGFAPQGAVLEDIQMLRKILKPSTQLKASGGIRSLQATQDFLAAGATRLGTSSGVALMNALMGQQSKPDESKGY